MVTREHVWTAMMMTEKEKGVETEMTDLLVSVLEVLQHIYVQAVYKKCLEVRFFLSHSVPVCADV